MLRTTIALALVVAAAPAQSMQSLPAGFLTADANSATAYPQNQTSDHKWQWHYDSTQFAATGPIQITEIYTRASTPSATVQAFNFNSWVVTLASSPTDYTVAGQGGVPGHSTTFAANLNGDATVVRTGPFTGGPVPPSGMAAATWIPWGLTGTFFYDPTLGNDFVIQIEKCGTTATWGTSMDGPSGSAGQNGGNRYGHTSSCSSPTSSFMNNEFVPVVRIDYIENNSLTATWSGPAVADFTLNLGMMSAGVQEGFTLVSTTTLLPVGQGPLYGILPDAITWIGLQQPAQVWNPFHFIVAPGAYPVVPLNLGPGTMTPFLGQEWDLAVVLFDGAFTFVGNSNVVRFSFN